MMRYRVTVKGPLTRRIEVFLGAITSQASDDATIVTVELRDQADLIGLVDRVSDLGLELIAVAPDEAGQQGNHPG